MRSVNASLYFDVRESVDLIGYEDSILALPPTASLNIQELTCLLRSSGGRMRTKYLTEHFVVLSRPASVGSIAAYSRLA